MIPLPFAIRPWAIIAAIGGVLVIIACVMAHGAGVKAQRKAHAPVIADLQTNLAQCRSTVATQGAALETQNAAIDQLEAEGQARAKAADVALRQAKRDADRYRRRAAQIAAAKPTGDQCVAARDLIVTTLKEDRQ